MISKDYSLNEFVDKVRRKASWEIVVLAIEEADRIDRLTYHKDLYTNEQLEICRCYSKDLKHLINYIRYESKPKRPENKAYKLYTANWADRQKYILTCCPLSKDNAK